MTPFAPDVQLNWLSRYLPLRGEFQGPCLDSLLEVGSGPRGLGCMLETPFIGIDIGFNQAPVPPMLPFSYDGNRLPFKDGAFHTVFSMDSLEHVPPPQRLGFLLELARVSANRVIMGCPVDAEGVAGDAFMQQLFRALGQGDPDWLHEHEEHGMPDSRNLDAIFQAMPGWRWRLLPTPGLMPSLLMVLADILPGMREFVGPVLQDEPEKLAAWIDAGCFGPTCRRVYLLERLEALEPIVNLKAPDTLATALVCPDCGGAIAFLPKGMGCGRCRRLFESDRLGVWPLIARTSSPVLGGEPITFVLAPDWLHDIAWAPVVHNYLHAFTPSDDVVLRLLVDPNELSSDEAVEILQPLLQPFGQQPFANLDLFDEPNPPAPVGRVVHLGAAGDSLLNWTPERFRLSRHVEPALSASEK